MGEQYRQTIEEKIGELGAENLRAFINQDGVNSHYRQHLENTFREAGVRFVSRREEANLVFGGNETPSYGTGQVVAFFHSGRLAFVGEF